MFAAIADSNAMLPEQIKTTMTAVQVFRFFRRHFTIVHCREDEQAYIRNMFQLFLHLPTPVLKHSSLSTFAENFLNDSVICWGCAEYKAGVNRAVLI